MHTSFPEPLLVVHMAVRGYKSSRLCQSTTFYFQAVNLKPEAGTGLHGFRAVALIILTSASVPYEYPDLRRAAE